MTTTTVTAIALARAIGPLRRALLKATRDAGDLPNLPEAQIEVLRLLVESGPVSSAGIALRLGLARPTVSNLLKAMTTSGLISRSVSAEDLRSTSVGASDLARGLLDRYDDVSARVIAEALVRLDATEQEHLHHAAQPLRVLAELVADLPPGASEGESG